MIWPRRRRRDRGDPEQQAAEAAEAAQASQDAADQARAADALSRKVDRTVRAGREQTRRSDRFARDLEQALHQKRGLA